MKVCEKCGREFEGSSRFCSRSCANSRTFSEESKQLKREAMLGRKFPASPQRLASFKETARLKRIADQVSWTCPQCGKVLILQSREASRRKYCSGTCRNIATNKYKNGKVSKAELILRELLKSAGYSFDCNRRDILEGLEIDIWIPSLNVAIEYNGIYHLEPIHGEEFLSRIREKDALKRELAKKKGFELIVLEDKQSSTKSVEALGLDLLNTLTNKGNHK